MGKKTRKTGYSLTETALAVFLQITKNFTIFLAFSVCILVVRIYGDSPSCEKTRYCLN